MGLDAVNAPAGKPVAVGRLGKFVSACLKKIVYIWACVSFVIALMVAMEFARVIGPRGEPRFDEASAEEVGDIMRKAGLEPELVEQVVHSYFSPRYLGGQHTDACVIKIKPLDMDALTAQRMPMKPRWFKCEELPPYIEDAVSMVAFAEWDCPWFPQKDELISSDVYMCVPHLEVHGAMVVEAKVFFIRPKDGMLFYLSADSA